MEIFLEKQGYRESPGLSSEWELSPNYPPPSGAIPISDELWAVLQPLLPAHVNTHRFGGGRPRVPDRDCADAIFFVLRTGSQWQALDQTELCAHSTAHDRFQEWVEAGVFLKLWQAGVEQFDEICGIEWDWLSMDGAMTKAPLGGEKKPGPIPPIAAKGRQTQLADGGTWSADWRGDRGGEPPCYKTGALDHRKHQRRASPAHRGPSTGNVFGQGI
jgi:transposase